MFLSSISRSVVGIRQMFLLPQQGVYGSMCGATMHYLDSMQSVHQSQTLTEEEVLKYALRKEEYVGVLGKEYAAKNQERRLAKDLTKLNSYAT